MLSVSRKKGEGILIGDEIRISVKEIRGNKVVLGIDAPREVEILRDELVKYELATVPLAEHRPGAA